MAKSQGATAATIGNLDRRRRGRGVVLTRVLVATVLLLGGAFSARDHARAGYRDESQVAAGAAAMPKAAGRSLHLVIEDRLLAALGGQIPADFRVVPKSKVAAGAILNAVAAGDSLVWIGEGSEIPKDLWIGTFRPAASALAVTGAAHSAIDWSPRRFRPSQLSSAFVQPTKLLPYHNVDEQPRAEFLPLLEARDRFGQVVGYPGVLMQYYAPSTVRYRFAGSECFFFLFDHPLEALDATGWGELLQKTAARFRAALQLKQVTSDYASYRLGERVRIRAQVTNWRPRAAATEVHFFARAPGEQQFQPILKHRRVPDGRSEAEATADFMPRGRAGLWTLRVEAWQDLEHAEEPAIVGQPVVVDRRDIGIVLLDGELKTRSIMSLNGPNIRLDGRDGFWAGTNYTPPNSWWDWQWRDFRPLTVADDFAAIRRTGYRLVRNWMDPVLDEQSLRAMDAAIYLAAQNGIMLELCAFTIHQWVRTIGFERASGEHVLVDFTTDPNLTSFSLQHIQLQREFLQVLAKRWRHAGNLIYNLSNEPMIRDPDPAILDKQVTEWEGIPKANGILRDSLLFRRWARELTAAIRQAGGSQTVIPGQMRMADNYLANRDSEIGVWHSYGEPESLGLSLAYMDPGCSGRPLLLEEFGARGVWNDERRYDGGVHYALATGATAAMSYEWGVSWLSPQLNFWPPLPRILSHHSYMDDLRRQKDSLSKVVGMFPAPSGFNWGSIYHGTPFPASAAIALGGLGRMGQVLDRAVRSENAYVVVPTAFNGDKEIDSKNALDAVTQTIKKLWQEKVVFGILQEDCLGSLAKSARVLICPKGVTAASVKKLDELRRSGVEVFTGADDAWRQSTQLRRVSVTSGEGVSLLVRRTTQGTLYALIKPGVAKAVTLTTESGKTASLGLTDYALAHVAASGINWVEGSGDVALEGSPFCRIERGRAIFASDDGLALVRSNRVRLLATVATRIKFARPISSIEVLEEGQSQPLATFAIEAADKSTLDIDSELARYVLAIKFQPT